MFIVYNAFCYRSKLYLLQTLKNDHAYDFMILFLNAFGRKTCHCPFAVTAVWVREAIPLPMQLCSHTPFPEVQCIPSTPVHWMPVTDKQKLYWKEQVIRSPCPCGTCFPEGRGAYSNLCNKGEVLDVTGQFIIETYNLGHSIGEWLSMGLIKLHCLNLNVVPLFLATGNWISCHSALVSSSVKCSYLGLLRK